MAAKLEEKRMISQPSSGSLEVLKNKDLTPVVESDPSCLLRCKNGSHCSRSGDSVGPWGSYKGVYCHCPEGFAGVECQTKAEVCGNGEHVCLHGKRCAWDEKAQTGYRCDCPSELKDCQDRKIDYCTLTGELKVIDRESNSTNKIPTFCTNGGKCKRKLDSSLKRHGGCHCPVPFTGDFCEITQLDINAALDKEIVATKGRIDSKELSLIIVIVAVAITVFIWLRRYLRARRARWMRGDDIVINLQSFRDEDGRGGGISANGNSLFPGMVVGSFD